MAGTEVVAVAGGGVSAPCLGNKVGNPFEQEIAEEAEKDLSPLAPAKLPRDLQTTRTPRHGQPRQKPI